MTIPTEPIGSIPRPAALIEAVAKNGGNTDDAALEPLFDAAIRDTIARFEATGSPVVTDGEQRKYHNFWDYCVHGLPNVAPDGFKIPFIAGHTRRMPRLTKAPFRYKVHADRAEEVRDRGLEAAELIPLDQLGTTDDCGFSPFSDDISTTRDTAFAKIAARVRGTALAEDALRGR